MRAITAALSFILVAFGSVPASLPAGAKGPVTDRQVAVMMFVDYGRAYGYQAMLAKIHVDSVKAELERDQKLLEQKEDLFQRQAIPPIELDIARLKDTWNRKQLKVAEKSLAAIAAQYEAVRQMAQHFAGVETSVDALYATFRRGWEAGCDKGPDEVAAMQAWAEYSKKALERSRQLNSQGDASFAAVLEKEAQFKIAQSNYEQRQARLDRCREVLFPTLDDILAVAR